MADAVVKIDDKLMNKIEKLLEEEEYTYSNRRQVVNLAIIEFLKSKGLIKSSRGGK